MSISLLIFFTTLVAIPIIGGLSMGAFQRCPRLGKSSARRLPILPLELPMADAR